MEDPAALLDKYLKAQSDKDLDILVPCWHPEVEVVPSPVVTRSNPHR